MASDIPPVQNPENNDPPIYYGTQSFIRDLRKLIQRYSGKRSDIAPHLPQEVIEALDTIHSYESKLVDLDRKIRN